MIVDPGDSGAVVTIAILVAVCLLIGIDRAWELIGGPSIGISKEVAELVRGRERGTGDETGADLWPWRGVTSRPCLGSRPPGPAR